jgi:hypothetical protein
MCEGGEGEGEGVETGEGRQQNPQGRWRWWAAGWRGCGGLAPRWNDILVGAPLVVCPPGPGLGCRVCDERCRAYNQSISSTLPRSNRSLGVGVAEGDFDDEDLLRATCVTESCRLARKPVYNNNYYHFKRFFCTK